MAVTFNNILGHDREKKLLVTTLRRERLSHAYLFTGVSGIGKRMVAKSFAAWSNCLENEDGTQDDACNACSSCRKVASGNHPDIIEIQPEKGAISIDKIRELSSKLAYRNFEGIYRCIIIDEAHSLNVAASNALLKLLEEPPSKTVFLMISFAPNLLLATIRSRCQFIRFSPLDHNLILKILENKGHAPGSDKELCMNMAEGSASLALQFFEEGFPELYQSLVQGFQELLKTGDIQTAFGFAAELDKIDDVDRVLHLLQLWCRGELLKEGTLRSNLVEAMDLIQTTRHALLARGNRSLAFENLALSLRGER